MANPLSNPAGNVAPRWFYQAILVEMTDKTLYGLRATQRHKEIRGIFYGGIWPMLTVKSRGISGSSYRQIDAGSPHRCWETSSYQSNVPIPEFVWIPRTPGALKVGNGSVISSTLHRACDYLSMLGLELNHVSKTGPYMCVHCVLDSDPTEQEIQWKPRVVMIMMMPTLLSLVAQRLSLWQITSPVITKASIMTTLGFGVIVQVSVYPSCIRGNKVFVFVCISCVPGGLVVIPNLAFKMMDSPHHMHTWWCYDAPEVYLFRVTQVGPHGRLMYGWTPGVIYIGETCGSLPGQGHQHVTKRRRGSLSIGYLAYISHFLTTIGTEIHVIKRKQTLVYHTLTLMIFTWMVMECRGLLVVIPRLYDI